MIAEHLSGITPFLSVRQGRPKDLSFILAATHISSP
jgi:hypothetical protein